MGVVEQFRYRVFVQFFRWQPTQGIPYLVVRPFQILQLHVVSGQCHDPTMTESIQVGCRKDVGQWIVIHPYCEGLVLEIFPKLLCHGPLEGQELELGGMILGPLLPLVLDWQRLPDDMAIVRILEEYGATPLRRHQFPAGMVSGNPANTRTGAVMHFFFRSSKAEVLPGLIQVL